MGCCKHDIGLLSPIKGVEFIDKLSDYELLSDCCVELVMEDKEYKVWLFIAFEDCSILLL